MSPPLVPSLDDDLHFVLCDFGRNGHAFVEMDPAHADRNTIIRNLIAGEYERPLSVVAFNLAEGWACDVSQSVAKAIVKANASLTAGTREFVENACRRKSSTKMTAQDRLEQKQERWRGAQSRAAVSSGNWLASIGRGRLTTAAPLPPAHRWPRA